jgi:predicted nucleic acid-binding protein
VSDVWVVNASPVIVLAKAGFLRLLEELPTELLLPDAVAAEILVGPVDDPARKAVENGWGARVSPKTIPAEILEWGLGPGETAVLAVGRERPSCTVVLDDAVARNCAKTFQLPLLGTLGIVLRAKQRGLVPEAAVVLRALRAAELHLDDRTIRLTLSHVGEVW